MLWQFPHTRDAHKDKDKNNQHRKSNYPRFNSKLNAPYLQRKNSRLNSNQSPEEKSKQMKKKEAKPRGKSSSYPEKPHLAITNHLPPREKKKIFSY